MTGDPPPDGADSDEPRPSVDRRRFFGAFSREAIQTAATVIGTATALRRESAAASGLLGPDPSTTDTGIVAIGTSVIAGAGRRRPYRLGDGVIWILDQRQLPVAAIDVECRSGDAVAWAMERLAVRGGPLLGQLAAYGMALAAEQCSDMKPYQRLVMLRGTSDALRAARPDVAAIGAAVDRCLAAWMAIREPAVGAEVAAAVRAVADSIVAEADAGLDRLVRDGADALAQPEGRPLEILTIDATGPLSGGPAGTALGIILAVAAAGRPVHVWITETRPSRTGARVAAAELQASGVPFTVIADGAVGWLMSERPVDAVLVGAERIATNGDVANVAGTYPMAVMAARHAAPLYVCAQLVAVDAQVRDGSGLEIAMRPASELLQVGAEPSAPPETDALVPLDDVTPAELVRAYITDAGVLQPPFLGSPAEPPDRPS